MSLFLQSAAMQGPTILSSPFVVYYILPFVLLFTVIFAILQKSKILGDGKKQIDAITSLSIALIVVSFANAVGIINALLPFLAVSVVVILVFLILLSMVYQGKDSFTVHKNIQIGLGIIIGIGVVVSVLIATGAWDYISLNWFSGGSNTAVMNNVVFIVVLLVAIAVLWFAGGKPKEE